MHRFFRFLPIFTTLVTLGCTDKNPPQPLPEPPKAPISQFRELSNDGQLMIAYVAAKPSNPIPYETIAKKISDKFSAEPNEFKRKDMLEALAPSIDNELATARSNPHYFLKLPDSSALGTYDFSNQSFSTQITGTGFNGAHFFEFVGGHNLLFSNGYDFNSIKVADENLARLIAAKRSELKVKVYFSITGANARQNQVDAKVIGMQIVDANNVVLAERFDE